MRDNQFGAIVSVKASPDMLPGISTLKFSIEKVPDSPEVKIVLSTWPKEGQKAEVYEQYRLRMDDAIANELRSYTAFEEAQEASRGHVLLKIKPLRQDFNLCAPTCASMALSYYGQDTDPHIVKSLSSPPNSTFAGTYFSDLVAGVAKIGYHWQVKSYPVNEEGFAVGLQDILRSLTARQPVLVDLFIGEIGHTILLIGYDMQAQQIYFLDPRDDAGAKHMSYQEFKDIWHSVVSESRGGIFTQPKN